jgi:hypothetical protein
MIDWIHTLIKQQLKQTMILSTLNMTFTYEWPKSNRDFLVIKSQDCDLLGVALVKN